MVSQYYKMLAEHVPTSVASIPPEFVLHEDGPLQVVWAPFDHINTAARVAIIGITPGWHQAQIAYTTAHQALCEGLTYSSACERAKAKASFAGTMRKNLVAMLDAIGVAQVLSLETTADMFGEPHPDLHTTSALRYPVFRSGKNYTGHTPHPLKNDYLRSMTETSLVQELVAIAPALVVPLGKAASDCVRHALSNCETDVTLLERFPHPSGANGHRVRQFEKEKGSLSHAVTEFGLTNG